MNTKVNELLAAQREISAKMANASQAEMEGLKNEYEANKREIEMLNQKAVAERNAPAPKKQTLVSALREAIKTNQRAITVQGYTTGSGESAVTTAGVHDHVVETQIEGILEPLYAKSALSALGVRWYKGMPMGDIQVPVMGAGSVAWAGEKAAASEGGNTFSHVTLKPNRMTAYVDISKQLLNQDNIGAEEAIRRDLANAIADKLEATVFGNAAGVTGEKPKGMFYGTNAARELTNCTDFGKICAMEAGIEAANIGSNVKYLLAPASKADLRAMATNGNGSKRVFEGGDVDGTPAVVTSNVAAGKFIYGDFSNLAIASWGDIEITVDPYTQAANGCVRLVVNAYFDAQILREAAFAYGRTRAL